MGRELKGWKVYELFVANLMAEDLPTGVSVTPNAKVRGAITGTKRQVDVLIDVRHDTDNARRVIVDAKARRRKVDVTYVESFEGLMRDVQASHGVIVCPTGYTCTAEARAQDLISVHLVPLDYLRYFNPTKWDRCLRKKCLGYVFWDGYPELSVVLAPASTQEFPEIRTYRYVHAVGKCEKCLAFHVKCFTCGEVFALGESDEHQCLCVPPWFWLSSIEQDDENRESAEVHCVRLTGEVITVDRRSM